MLADSEAFVLADLYAPAMLAQRHLLKLRLILYALADDAC